MKCPKCGRFLKNVMADIDGDNNVTEVEGTCSKHGKVNPTDWDYEDFFPYSKSEIERLSE
jgi:hypothetical protein